MPVQKTESDFREILKRKKDYKSEIKNGFPVTLKNKSPVIGIWYDNTKDKNLVAGLAEALNSINASTVLFHHGDNNEISFDFREKTAAVSVNSKTWRMFFEACDMMIVFPDAIDENFFYDLWRNGIVPIAPKSLHPLSNYNPNDETGNSFTYESKNIWEVFASTIRAVETFKFPYDWKHIIKQGMKNL